MKHALSVTRAADFAAWYQDVIKEADLAEDSGVRGCMVIRPWGYGIWERIQRLLDDRIKATGHENCYFPIFIPLSYFEKEAAHVDGFAKEMAVVTHHRLIGDGKGGLIPDPAAKLEEPLIVRPTSETVIGAAMARWVQSWRDLPVLINQWANVVRWEMRTRMFLRTSEFLWQEGHTAHATREEAIEETLKMLEVYREFAETCLAMPVIAGEKPEHERFPGADATYSIEAMMQDGKALQAGTSHFLGQTFSKAQDIKFQNSEGQFAHAWTTSWGVSTRMIGGVIMVHGDDDGLRLPPAIAPQQVIIMPRLQGDDDDGDLLTFCESVKGLIAAQSVLAERIRVHIDKKPGKIGPMTWGWIKKGAPLIIHVGKREMEADSLTYFRRDALYNEVGQRVHEVMSLADIDRVPSILESIQMALHSEATVRRDAAIKPVASWADLEAHFTGGEDDVIGWVSADWSRPTGAALEDVVKRLKVLKLTARNTPVAGAAATGPCIFTGEPATEKILIGRTY
ncbi:MAG: aminoacyl--tRNA ligase-related protein [Sphingomonadales bacterium]